MDVQTWLESVNTHVHTSDQSESSITAAENDDADPIEDLDEICPPRSGLRIPRQVKRFKGFFEYFSQKRTLQHSGNGLDVSPRSTRSHSTCFSSASMGSEQCNYMDFPVRLANNIKKVHASDWTEKQTVVLHWNPSEFPDIDADPINAINMEHLDLPDNSVSNWCLRNFCLKPIMQWLLGTGVFEPHDVKNESEVSAVAVSEAIKEEILKELTGSYMCKIAMAIREATDNVSVKTLTVRDLEAIILGVQDVPETYLDDASLIYTEWLSECKKDKIEKDTVTALMNSIVNLLFNSEELIPTKLYKLRLTKATKRTFDMCGVSNIAENDLEVRVIRDGPSIAKEWLDNYKVLTMSENKVCKYGMEGAYPQMVCQFVAAAKHARFHTNNHHILYNVSICGKNTILLARAHVWKQLVKRTEQCIPEETEFGNSHFLHRTVEFKIYNNFDVFPILNIYMAVKATLLLHLKTPLE